MKWKEDLHTVKERGILSQTQYEQLLKLPDIRDELFFPSYKKFGYTAEETFVEEWEIIITLNLCLISVSKNRKLTIQYSFLKLPDKVIDGAFNDLIHILSAKTGWENTVYMDVLVKKDFGIELGKYNLLTSYTGTFTERCEACLSKIKENYDTFAFDIINGEKWDANAWQDYRG